MGWAGEFYFLLDNTYHGCPRNSCKTFQIQVEPGSSVRQILASQFINPLLVPMISRDSRKIPLDTILEEDVTLTLYGPLAGG